MTAVIETAPLPFTEFTGPGVYDMTADAYHADPVPSRSLSSSGARKLLPPSCPAKFRHDQVHGQGHKKAWDIGHAAHMLVLGEGPELVRIDADEWRTNAIKAEVKAVYDRGAIPLKPADFTMVHDMAAAIRKEPLAAKLLQAGGQAEQSLFWQDELAGVWLRARPDWIGVPIGGMTPVVDYKTTLSAEPQAIRKSVANYGYHQQDPWYIDGINALGLVDNPVFFFIFQEKAAPYLITVSQLEQDAIDVGRARNRQAIDTYAACDAAEHWPGYTSDVVHTSLPAWADTSTFQEI